MTCEFFGGDRVDLQGKCFLVVKRVPFEGSIYLHLQTDAGPLAVPCESVTSCVHMNEGAMRNLAESRPAVADATAPLPGEPPSRPHGIAAVIETFGDPFPFAQNKAGWERKALKMTPLAKPLIYAYDQTQGITRIRGHKLLVDHLAETLTACLDAGVATTRLKYGGCYVWRPMRSRAELSTHTWGIAVDLEPAENPMGQPWQDDGRRLDARIIDVFERRGWYWGGHFNGRPDPMHFQWATGY